MCSMRQWNNAVNKRHHTTHKEEGRKWTEKEWGRGKKRRCEIQMLDLSSQRNKVSVEKQEAQPELKPESVWSQRWIYKRTGPRTVLYLHQSHWALCLQCCRSQPKHQRRSRRPQNTPGDGQGIYMSLGIRCSINQFTFNFFIVNELNY